MDQKISIWSDENRKFSFEHFLIETKGFFATLFKNPFFLAMSAIFVIGKFISNMYFGAGILTSLRSGLLGFLIYILACYWIHMFTINLKAQDRNTSGKNALGVVLWVAVIIGFLAVNVLRDIRIVRFEIPVWSQLEGYWSELVQHFISRYEWMEGTGIIGWPYLLLYVFVPLLLARRYGIQLPKLTGWKSSLSALPFVVVYMIGFVAVKGLSAGSIFSMLAVIVWPAFGEEFLFRGILQRVLHNMAKNSVTAIVLTSVLFAGSHIPIYVLAASGPVLLGWSGLLPIMLTSFFWGYGYYRTGVLWPWVFIHAASNLIGL